MVTFRDDALAPADTLRVALGELAGQRCTRRIDLPPLTPAGVRRLAEGTSYLPDELHRLTGGNPFFVVEVLGEPGDEVPASARDAVLARAARLDDVARATLGPGLPRRLPRRPAPGRRAPPVLELETLDELVAAGLLTADGDTLRFRHELSRRAVESAVPPHRRAGRPPRPARRPVARDCDDDDAGWPTTPRGPATPTWSRGTRPRAARQAAALGRPPRGGAQYERALRFPPDDPRALAELYDGYADALALVDRWPQAAEARERAIDDLARARRRPPRGARPPQAARR